MRFAYRGADRNGEPVHGETSAQSPEKATSFLREQGIEVTELKPVGESKLQMPSGAVDSADVATFCEQLANLTESGMPLPDALEAIARDASSGKLQSTLDRLAEGVRQGRDLADMIEVEKHTFPPMLTALVRAGQKSGKLTETLRLAGTHLWRLSVLRDRVKSAVAYPLMVFVFLCIIGSIVFVQVVPRFESMFDELGVQIKPVTQGVLFVGNHFPAIAGGILGLMALIFILFRYVNAPSAWVRARRWILFHLPLFGRIFQSAFLCRFSRLASMLLNSGCSMADTLDLLAELEKERLSYAGGKAMAKAVRNGKSLSDAMRARLNVFPELLVWTVESCETSGRLPEGFEEAADIYQRETERHVDVLNSTLPGVCVFVVGACIALTAMGLFAPLVSLMSNLSG